MKDNRVIYRYERQFDTEEVIRIDRNYYVRVVNGGTGGSRSQQRGDGSYDTCALRCEAVTQEEAIRKLLEFGLEPEAVDELLDLDALEKVGKGE